MNGVVVDFVCKQDCKEKGTGTTLETQFRQQNERVFSVFFYLEFLVFSF